MRRWRQEVVCDACVGAWQGARWCEEKSSEDASGGVQWGGGGGTGSGRVGVFEREKDVGGCLGGALIIGDV